MGIVISPLKDPTTRPPPLIGPKGPEVGKGEELRDKKSWVREEKPALAKTLIRKSWQRGRGSTEEVPQLRAPVKGTWARRSGVSVSMVGLRCGVEPESYTATPFRKLH